MRFGKKLAVGTMLLASTALVLIGGFAVEQYLSKDVLHANVAWEGHISENNRYVFYPRYLSDNCAETLAALDKGELKLDNSSSEVIGLNPIWNLSVASSGYSNFNLHTLRFTSCLIKEGGEGNIKRLGQADIILRSWLANNQVDSSASGWAWTEHATSWRAIVFSYFLLSAQRVNYLVEDDDISVYTSAINEHIDFIKRPSVYRPDHNHGLNNALALLALAMVVNDSQTQRELLQLGFLRAEQQMADNVSSDGIHLEQSGFYQFYTIRSFLEILRVARNIGWPVSDQYQSKLAGMINAGLYMAGRDERVDGMPYSKLKEIMTSIFDMSPDLVRDGRLLAKNGNAIVASSHKRLSVHAEGGYSFFSAEHKDDLEVVFHTRILDAPHAHQDALGVTVRDGNGALIPFTSTMHVSDDIPQWKKYFLGSASHNGVTVEGIKQIPLDRRREGFIATITDSWKLNSVMEKVGLVDWFTVFRQRHQLDRRSLQERAVSSGGEVLNSGSQGIIDYVTARHTTYADIEQLRTVVKVGANLLLIWDRLHGDEARQYVQRFHFSPDSSIELEGRGGTIEKNGRVIARSRQLMPVETWVCRGEGRPDPCGWYTDTSSLPRASPVLMHSVTGEQVEFLWVLQSGRKPLKVLLEDEGNGGDHRVQVNVNGSQYTVKLSEQGVTAELTSFQ